MPSDIAGNYSLPAGYLAVAGTTILTTQHNPIFQDVAQGLTDRIMANGAKAMTAELTLAGNPVTLLGAAPKQYVDAQALAAVAALDIKPSVVAATTANITLSAPQTIDGVSVTAADRVLVKNQTTPAENGIYIVGSAAWSRATDMDAWAEVPGAIVAVEGGTQWQDTLWLCTANASGTIGSTAMPWRRFDTNVTRNAQTGTSYTISTDDHNRHITTSNASAIATTLPQATGNFGFGFSFIIQNIGAGLNTITPTTSTINGAATLTVSQNESYRVTSDGTNYRALPYGPAFSAINALPEDTAPDWANDFFPSADASATASRKVRLNALAVTGAISGLTLSRNAVTTLGIAVGSATSEANGHRLAIGSAFTKTLSSWAVGTGNGGLDTGSVAINTWYHTHIIRRDSDGLIDFLHSTSATAPTMPSGYTARRRIGSFRTDGSAQIIAFSQFGDEFLWDAAVIDLDAVAPGATAVTRTLTVPTGVKVIALFDGGVNQNSVTGFAVNFSSLDSSDQASQLASTAALTGIISVGGANLGIGNATWHFASQRVRTNTSGQIRSRASSAATAAERVGIITRGWIDFRGRD